jgi:predicted Zn-dependent protease
LAYAPLERAAQLPGSSILPEQALIFMNARMHLPLKEEWWQSMIIKLKAHPVGVQDESSLGTLTQCMRDGACELPVGKMTEVYLAAVINHKPSARLLAMYADFAWNVLGDRALALRMAYQSAMEAPNEPAYHITLARMLIASGQPDEANQQIEALQRLNLGGRLNESIQALKQLQRQSPE